VARENFLVPALDPRCIFCYFIVVVSFCNISFCNIIVCNIYFCNFIVSFCNISFCNIIVASFCPQRCTHSMPVHDCGGRRRRRRRRRRRHSPIF